MEWTSLYDERIWTRDFWVKVVAYYSQNYTEFNMLSHSHGEVEIMYVMKGRASVIISEIAQTNAHTRGLKVEKIADLKAGDLIIVDAGVWHKLLVPPDENDPCLIYNVEFTFREKSHDDGFLLRNTTGYAEGLSELLKEAPRYKVLADEHGYFSRLFPMMLHELAHQEGAPQPYATDILIQLMFTYLSRLHQNNEKKSLYISHVQKALRYIEERYDENIKVTDIAQHINLHPTYLQRIFKQVMGESIVSHLTRFRMEKAKMMLESTELPIIDIAISVGYNNRQNFAHVFNKTFQVSAKQYRDNYLKNNNNLVYVGFNASTRPSTISENDL